MFSVGVAYLLSGTVVFDAKSNLLYRGELHRKRDFDQPYHFFRNALELSLKGTHWSCRTLLLDYLFQHYFFLTVDISFLAE
jgi:hypothetical protein